MRRRDFILLLTGALFVALVAFRQVNNRNENTVVPAAPKTSEAVRISYQDITAWELNGMLAQKNFFLVNVHIPYEGEIAKTDSFIPYDQIEKDLDQPAGLRLRK